jgi:predicted dehydrogenase
VPGLLAAPDVELAAICDADIARAETLAGETGVPGVYGSAAAMLEKEALDLVSIVTPDDCHRADAELALAAGAHVLCEKPLAGSVADARLLRDLAEATSVQTKVGFALRYAPAMLTLHDLVSRGAIGAPQLFQAFQQNGQFLDPAAPFHWKMDSARSGGGAIVEYGIHTLDLARWIMGDIACVSAAARTWIPERPRAEGSGFARVDVDDSTGWLMEFASGALGVCHAGWATVGRPPGLELRVFGSQGAARCVLSDDLPNAEGLWLAGSDGHFGLTEVPERFLVNVQREGHWWFRWPARLIHGFVEEIKTNSPAGPTFADGLRAQEALEAVQLAVAERRWIDLPS